MLSLAFIREHPDAVRTAIAQKNVALDLDALLALDGEVRALKTRVTGCGVRNAISDGRPSRRALDLAAPAKYQADLGAAEKSAVDHGLGTQLPLFRRRRQISEPRCDPAGSC